MNDGPLLQDIGASNSPDDIHPLLEDEQGRELDYAIQTDVGMSAPAFVNEGSKNPIPLYLKQANNLYWYEYSPIRKTIYLQTSAFVDKKSEPFDVFCKRMFEAFDERGAERLIVGVRRSAGGNHIELPLVKGILNGPALAHPDRCSSLSEGPRSPRPNILYLKSSGTRTPLYSASRPAADRTHMGPYGALVSLAVNCRSAVPSIIIKAPSHSIFPWQQNVISLLGIG